MIEGQAIIDRIKKTSLNLMLVGALTPAILACSPTRQPTQPERNTSLDLNTSGSSRNTRENGPNDRRSELVAKGLELIRSRPDCFVRDLDSEMTDVLRGVPTYQPRQFSPQDPNYARINAIRALDREFLKARASTIRSQQPSIQAERLSDVYLDMAGMQVEAMDEASGSLATEMLENAKCYVVKYITLQVIKKNQEKPVSNGSTRMQRILSDVSIQ